MSTSPRHKFETARRMLESTPAPEGAPFVSGPTSELLRHHRRCRCRNPHRYTAEGTTVEIRLERETTAEGDNIVVRVVDPGPGVPPEDLEKIFQPFYRLDDARIARRAAPVSACSIAGRAVRLHGGRCAHLIVQRADQRSNPDSGGSGVCSSRPFLIHNYISATSFGCSVRSGWPPPADGKRLGEQMSKKTGGIFAFLGLLGLSVFLLSCGTKVSRSSGLLFVVSQAPTR